MNKEILPELSYSYDALEPVISAEIMQIHHQKHHNAYVTNLNASLEKYAQAEKEGDLSAMISLQQAIRFNGGGHLNHSIFWTNLAPISEGGGSLESGELRSAIDQKWGSLDKMIEAFNALTAPVQGSGWGWLGFCPKARSLELATCANQDPLQATTGMIPLLGVDVWEHAYYLQYKNVRPEYLKNIWKVVNWKNVEARYAEALSLFGVAH